ncbi:hypothetical protein [Actinobaculum sp. 352]|uniref:hypothetical protein n=1 Tax=Actinobaculum sp. 352 TaxID=2490946 RepID=UPI000F7F4012|nr:hypothetical protein [Actinobaculum sp. 352]RTE47887.1 hypothetical protein EKN07_11550 [Actinobaculum sp. 352]
MRLGPSLETTWAATVDCELVAYRAGRVLATAIPNTDSLLEVSAGNMPAEKLTFTAPRDWTPTSPYDPLNNYGQELGVTVRMVADGVPWHVNMGRYMVTGWAEKTGGVQVTAVGLLQRLVENPAVWPSSPPAGATLYSEARRLAPGLPIRLHARDRGIPRTFEWGTSRVEALQELCDSYGLDMLIRADGYLHLVPHRDGGSPDITYRDVVIEAPRESVNRRANQWIVYGKETDGVQPIAITTADEAPYDPGSYGRLVEHHQMSIAEDQSAVTAAAGTYMRKRLNAARKRSISVRPDPRIEIGDIIQAISDTEIVTGRVTGYSLPLVAGTSKTDMRIDVEELQW